MSEAVNKAAGLILAAHRDRTRFASGDLSPITDAEAYAVQDLVAETLWHDHGGRPTAWKVGADSRDSVPSTAPMAPPMHVGAVTLSAGRLGLMIVEMELAYRFGRALPPRETPYSLEEVSDAIESVHTAIEIVDTRLSDRDSAPAFAKLADNLSNGAFVMGEGTTEWRKMDPRTLAGVFRVNAKVHERVRVAHPLGNPLVLLPWWVAHMCRRNESRYGGVRVGDVVTTGSLNKPVQCKAGDVVVAEFPGVGNAEVRFSV